MWVRKSSNNFFSPVEAHLNAATTRNEREKKIIINQKIRTVLSLSLSFFNKEKKIIIVSHNFYINLQLRTEKKEAEMLTQVVYFIVDCIE